MHDPRDFLAFTQFGILGTLLLGIGLLGVLIHRNPVRLALSTGVGLLGILFLSEGGTLFHGATISVRPDDDDRLVSRTRTAIVDADMNAARITESSSPTDNVASV